MIFGKKDNQRENNDPALNEQPKSPFGGMLNQPAEDFEDMDEEEFFAQLSEQTEAAMRQAEEMPVMPTMSSEQGETEEVSLDDPDDDGIGIPIMPDYIAPYVPTIPDLPELSDFTETKNVASATGMTEGVNEATENTAEQRVRDFDTVLVNAEDDVRFAAAAQALAEGEVVGMPTETVYGLGCNALLPEAVEKVYKAKGRPSDNPLIVHIADKNMIASLVAEVTPVAQALIDAFMPGPITIIMKKNPIIPDVVTAGRDTVGIRFPIHPVAQKLIAASGVPVAAPSANLSGSPSPTKAEHVMKDMDGRIPFIVEGGECQVGLESTVVDATGNWPQILRPGAVTMSVMEEAMAAAGIAKPEEVIAREMKPGEAPMAPGMKYRHYAPSCEVRVIGTGDFAKYPEYYREAVMRALSDWDKPVGLFASAKIAEQIRAWFGDKLDDIRIFEYGETEDVHAASHALFDGLRTLDEMGCKVIYAPAFPEEEMGIAYMNRLNKAAAGNKEGKVNPDGVRTMRKVLFVCSGNTCRSPLAEAILRYLWKKTGPHCLIDQPEQEVTLEVASAGVNADEGSPYTIYTVRLANFAYDEDISEGMARQITADMLNESDLVLCMTKEHSRSVRFLYPDFCKNVYSFQEMLDDLYIPEIDGEVSDPYGGDYLTYQATGSQLKEILQKLLPELLKTWGVS